MTGASPMIMACPDRIHVPMTVCEAVYSKPHK